MQKGNIRIFIRTQFEGIHMYPGAVALPGVEFLANPHRHMFHVEVQLDVRHEDRELEFILVKRDIDSYLSDKSNCDYKSCEMISDGIANYLDGQSRYWNRHCTIIVSEDGENGSITHYYLGGNYTSTTTGDTNNEGC